MKRSIAGVILLAWCTAVLGGCATPGTETSLSDEPVAPQARGGGVLFLAVDGEQWAESGEITSLRQKFKMSPALARQRRKNDIDIPPRITLVKVKNEAGRLIGHRVLPFYAGDVLLGELSKELTARGYTVRFVPRIPGDARFGIDVSGISADIEQRSGLLKLEVVCAMQVHVDVWRNGSKVNSRSYESKTTDYSLTDQQQLPLNLMMQTTRNIVQEAIPDITGFKASSRP